MTVSILVKKWAELVCAKDMNGVLALYNKRFYIKPTLYNKVVKFNKDDLKDYFEYFLKKNDIVDVQFTQTITQKYGNLILDMGNYRFVTRNKRFFDANYTFLHDNKTIMAHHSSHFNPEKNKYD